MFEAQPRMSRRALAAAVVLACFSATFFASPAEARRKAQPVITKAPKKVRYGDEIKISGEVRRARPGRKVYLKRHYAGIGKKIIREKRLSKDRTVTFTLFNATKTADYRLVLNPGPNRRVSDARRIEVKPRLSFNIEPNHVKTRKSVRLSGRLLPAISGRNARVQIRVKGKWRLLEKIPADDGTYRRTLEPDFKGHRLLRAVFLGDELNARAKKYERLSVYRRGEATWYGPGFYGNTTACGQTLRRKTLGVAHRTLPCGTKVDFLYKARRITVRVIDRGPYGEADWDLTNATAKRLRFEGRDIIGYLVH